MKVSKEKKQKLKARGIRFSAEQWDHLERMAGQHSTPSDYNRFLVQNDINKVKKVRIKKEKENLKFPG